MEEAETEEQFLPDLRLLAVLEVLLRDLLETSL